MSNPTWRQIATVDVPEAPGVTWTLACDQLKSGKLIRIVAEGVWKPQGCATDIKPDGDLLAANAGSEFLDTAPFGCLIGRIGMSTAASTTTDFTFPVGRTAVLTVPSDKAGALFLAVNDHPSRMGAVTGKLTVKVFAAL